MCTLNDQHMDVKRQRGGGEVMPVDVKIGTFSLVRRLIKGVRDSPGSDRTVFVATSRESRGTAYGL